MRDKAPHRLFRRERTQCARNRPAKSTEVVSLAEECGLLAKQNGNADHQGKQDDQRCHPKDRGGGSGGHCPPSEPDVGGPGRKAKQTVRRQTVPEHFHAVPARLVLVLDRERVESAGEGDGAMGSVHADSAGLPVQQPLAVDPHPDGTVASSGQVDGPPFGQEPDAAPEYADTRRQVWNRLNDIERQFVRDVLEEQSRRGLRGRSIDCAVKAGDR